eukprot:SAG31_NODE_1951_length_6831_cov_2.867053_3_plen_99_part_00
MVYTTQQRREIVLRFTPGERVECMFTGTWVKATVHSCWYKEPAWPTDTWCAAAPEGAEPIPHTCAARAACRLADARPMLARSCDYLRTEAPNKLILIN